MTICGRVANYRAGMGDAEGARGGFAEPPPNLSGKQDHYATYLWTSEEMA